MTMRTIRQNLVWAFGYNVVLIPVAMGMLYPFTNGLLLDPVIAAAAMALSFRVGRRELPASEWFRASGTESP